MLSLVALCLGATIQLEVAPSAADAKPLKVGDKAPDANLRDIDDKPVTLQSVLGGKPSILIFYRGGWCPFCNRHLADLQTIESQVLKLGYQIVAVSPDTPKELNKTLDRHSLTYKLFSDSSAEAMKKYGVAFRLDDKTFDLYRDQYKIDIEAASGETHHILPVPSVFVIDKDGVITYVHSNPDYKVRLKGSDILKVISPSG